MVDYKDTWPNLFIVGPPRSGTTTLHDWLGQHPDIFMSSIKEPHFFSSIEFPEIERKVLRVTRNQQEYLSLFRDGEEMAIRGESSSHYLADPASAERIHEMAPDAKIITILRDPIQRSFSHFLLFGRRGEQPAFNEVIRQCIERQPPYDNTAFNLVDMGLYHQQLEHYYQFFSPEQVLVVSFQKLQNQPTDVLREICDFLEVDKGVVNNIDTDQASNPYMQPSNRLFGKLLSSNILTSLGLKITPRPLLQKIRYGLLLKPGEKPELDTETRRLLTEIYEPEVGRLEKLLNRDFASLRESFYVED
jgi:hypothetical protein